MKKIRQLSTHFAFFMAISILVASCSSSTNIYTNPKGATVYMNGMKIGTTPYTMTDTKVAGTVTHLTFVKEGYEDLDISISKNEELDVGALVGGLFFLIPFIWIQKYSAQHAYDLIPLNGTTPMDSATTLTAPETNVTVASKSERIKELKQLLDDGLITQLDYDNAKKKILEEN